MDCELRAEGRTLLGIAVRYGDTASIWGGNETILPGALSWDDVLLNRQHERTVPLARTGAGLELIDTPEALEIRAELPHTRDADDVLELVRRGVLRGLSVGFHATEDRWEKVGEKDHRTVVKGRLDHIAVVDRPAYKQSTVATRHQTPRRRRIWL